MFFLRRHRGDCVKKVKNLTQFLTAMAVRNESTENGLYQILMRHPMLKSIDALDPDLEEKIKSAITKFVSESFEELIQDICAQYALLLLEIKNQKDAHEITGKPADIVALEKLGAEQAEKFKIVVDVVRHAMVDVDWEHIAERVIEAGKKKREKNPFSNN